MRPVVTFGYNTAASLREKHPDIVFDDYTELVDAVQRKVGQAKALASTSLLSQGQSPSRLLKKA